MVTITRTGRDRPAGPPRTDTGRAAGGAGPQRSRLPYLLLLPALILELAVHIIPMLVGVWMSLLELTQFHIRDWSSAPFVGLANYRATLDVHTPTGQQLLQSFGITVVYTVLSVGLSWVFGLTAAGLLQRPVRGRAPARTLVLRPHARPGY